MRMKIASALVLVAGLLWAGGALADPPDGKGPAGNGPAAGNGQGPGNNNAGGNGQGPGNNNAGGNTPDGPKGNGVGPDKDPPVSPPAPPPIEAPDPPAPPAADQNDALDAVRNGGALPLDVIVGAAQQRWGGRVIEAKLLRSKSALVYQLTMLSDDGVSRRVYYDARSGRATRVK